MSNVIFDTGHLRRTYFKLAIPGVLSMVVTVIYNFTDTYFIAQTGDANLVAGVSLCLPLMTCLMAFGNMFGQGGSSLISRMLGRGDGKSAGRVSSFCFWISIFIGAALAFLCLLFKTHLLTLLGADEATLPHASPYFTVCAVSSPVIVLNYIHTNLVRCEGFSSASMRGNILGTVVNIILDPVFIFKCGLGAMGAAVATVLGYASGVLYLLVFVLRRSSCLSVSIAECRVNKLELSQIMGVGFTAAIANLMQSFAQVLLNNSLLPYGNNEIAAMGIASKVYMVSMLIVIGFSFGGVPLFGYVYGTGDKRKLRELVTFCLVFLCSLSLVFTVLLTSMAPFLIRIFMEQEDIVRSGTLMLRLLSAGTVFAAVSLLFTVYFQATGRVVPAFLMSISRQGVIFFAVLLLMRYLFGYTGVLSSQLAADVISASLALSLYVKGKDGN